MRSPAVLNGVQVSDREDELSTVPIDCLAPVADSHAMVDESAIEKNLSFSLLSATWEVEENGTDPSDHFDRIATVRDVLRSSFVHLNQSHLAIADLQELIRSSVRLIQTSQRLIVESDSIIARARYGAIDYKPMRIP